MMMVKRFLLIAAVLLLAACANVTRIEGDPVVNERLVVHVSDAWNQVSDPWDKDPYDTWTQEGLPLDHLRLWGGVHPGQPLMTKPFVFSRAADAKEPRVPTFRTGLTPERLVSLFEELYANAGEVTITKVEPTKEGVTVHVTETAPSPNTFVTPAVTSPYQMQVIPKTEGKVTFKTTQK